MPNEMNSQNCANCQHAREKSTFPRCVGCLKDAAHGNQFPRWQAKETP